MCSNVTVCVAKEDGEGVSALRQRLLRVQVPQLAKFIVLQAEYEMMTRGEGGNSVKSVFMRMEYTFVCLKLFCCGFS